MTEQYKGGEGPTAAVHRRLDALEQRMTDELAKLEERIALVERDRYRVPQCEHCGINKVIGALADARPDDDPEMRERVGHALGVEDRTQPPHGMRTETTLTKGWIWRSVPDFGDEALAIAFAWKHHDSITAPLRAECERLREQLAACDAYTKSREKDCYAWEAECEHLQERVRELEAQNKRNADNFDELSSGYLERAEKAEAALADCQLRSAEVADSLNLTILRLTNDLADCQRERDQWHEERDRVALAHQKQRDIIASNVVLTDRLRREAETARRSTIEELVREANEQTWYSNGTALDGIDRVIGWLEWRRSQLDTEPTEQPTPDAPRPARFRDPTWCPDCDDEAMIDDSDGGICQGCGTMTAADKRDAVAEARKQERERCARVAMESPTAEIAARRIRLLPTQPESEGDQ